MRAQRLQYTADAVSDLREIRLHLSEAAGARVAARMIRRLREAVSRAREMPLAGTPRTEYRANCRFVVQAPYVIYYAYDGATLTVLRLLHQARDRDELMGDA